MYDNEELKVEALNVAAKLAMSSNLQAASVLDQARLFYGFLSGTETVDPTKVAYRLVPEPEPF